VTCITRLTCYDIAWHVPWPDSHSSSIGCTSPVAMKSIMRNISRALIFSGKQSMPNAMFIGNMLSTGGYSELQIGHLEQRVSLFFLALDFQTLLVFPFTSLMTYSDQVIPHRHKTDPQVVIIY